MGVVAHITSSKSNQSAIAVQSCSKASLMKFIAFSTIGIFMFFIPITIQGKYSIMLDHIVSAIQQYAPSIVPYYALFIIFLGALYPFYTGKWKNDSVSIGFSFFKMIGLFVAIMLVFNVGPAWLFDPNMGPFLWNKLGMKRWQLQTNLQAWEKIL